MLNRRRLIKAIKIIVLIIAVLFSIGTLLDFPYHLNVVATLLNSIVAIWMALITKH